MYSKSIYLQDWVFTGIFTQLILHCKHSDRDQLKLDIKSLTHGVTKEQKKANYCLCFLKDILWSVFFHVGVQNDTFFIFASSSLYSSFTELYNNAS